MAGIFTPSSQSGAVNDTVVALKHIWSNEKCAPEILPYQADVVDQLLNDIEAQERKLMMRSTQRRSADDLSYWEDKLYQMDLNRVKFLLSDYLRTRLLKIDKFALHLLKNDELRQRLSQAEEEYARRYADALGMHLHNSVLRYLPERFRLLTQQTGDIDMIPKPNRDSHVFCRLLRDVGDFQISDEGDPLDMRQGDVYALRYGLIADMIDSNNIQLI